MTIENMKDFLKHRYPTSAWAKKVEVMSNEQIIAIYKRLTAAEKPVVTHAPLRVVTYGAYDCDDCKQTFIADNPELQECRFCGSKNISVTLRTCQVRKG